MSSRKLDHLNFKFGQLIPAGPLGYLTEPGGGFRSRILPDFNFVSPGRQPIHRVVGSSV
jgi:hypothetical protein